MRFPWCPQDVLEITCLCECMHGCYSGGCGFRKPRVTCFPSSVSAALKPSSQPPLLAKLFFYACRDLLESLLNSYLYTRLTHPHSACFCFTIYSVWSFQYWTSALVKELFSWLFSTLPKCLSACVPASRNTWKHWKHFYLQQSSWGFILLNVLHFSTFTHIWVFRVTLTHLTFSDSVSVTLRISLLFRIRRSASLLFQSYASCINMSEGFKNIVN